MAASAATAEAGARGDYPLPRILNLEDVPRNLLPEVMVINLFVASSALLEDAIKATTAHTGIRHSRRVTAQSPRPKARVEPRQGEEGWKKGEARHDHATLLVLIRIVSYIFGRAGCPLSGCRYRHVSQPEADKLGKLAAKGEG